MELKSMTDFVLEQNENLVHDVCYNYNKSLVAQCCDRIFNYANFLKKPLKLGYFIPCDENDVPLEEPENYIEGYDSLYNDEIIEWHEAKQRVLFERFKINLSKADTIENIVCISNNNFQITFFKVGNIFLDDLETNKTTIISNIEDLIGLNLKLTKTAKKEIKQL